MTRENRTAVIAGRIIALGALAAVALYLSTVGLEKAKSLAAIGGAFVAVAALLGPYLLPSRPTPPPAPERSPARGPAPEPDPFGVQINHSKGIQVSRDGQNHMNVN